MSPRHLIVTAILLLSAGCRTGPGNTAQPIDQRSPEDMAKSEDLAKRECMFPQRSRCSVDSNCRRPFETCQSGWCCSGVFDPGKCTCLCGATPCDILELCCPGDPTWVEYGKRNLPDLGTYMCRQAEECYPAGPPK